MRDETSEGAAYLSSLKRSGSAQAAGAATARSPDVRHSAETRAGHIARTSQGAATAGNRRSPRYECQGSVRLQEISSPVSTWAKFADISLHGCYVEAATPLRVGTVLGLRLELNGIRVEATGEVRVAYPNLGMGISFAKMSEGDKKRLHELVGSISPPAVILGSRVVPRSPSIPQSDALPPIANPGAALQAMLSFFEDRRMMGREEFLRILRKSQ